MSGEVKITVIATGFDEGVEAKKQTKPSLSEASIGPIHVQEPQPVQNYPTYSEPEMNTQEESEDELEVPAFIRRKLK
jgi:hypothetical protein